MTNSPDSSPQYSETQRRPEQDKINPNKIAFVGEGILLADSLIKKFGEEQEPVVARYSNPEEFARKIKETQQGKGKQTLLPKFVITASAPPKLVRELNDEGVHFIILNEKPKKKFDYLNQAKNVVIHIENEDLIQPDRKDELSTRIAGIIKDLRQPK